MWEMRARSFLFATAVILSFCFSPVIAQSAHNPSRTLVAEGDSILHTKDGDKLLFHWKIWRLDDGGYEVVDVSALNELAVQTYRFDAQLLPIGFGLQVGRPPGASNSGQASRTTISCEYKPKELHCKSESSDGHKSEASIAAEPPFVCMGEFYGYDFLWLLTGVVRLASQGNATHGAVNTFDWTESKPWELGLEKDEQPITISLIGQETRQEEGKKQTFKLYQWDDKEAPFILRVNSQGIVVGMSTKSDPQRDMVTISNYKEYEPWGEKR
jgi:hypothetical protein